MFIRALLFVLFKIEQYSDVLYKKGLKLFFVLNMHTFQKIEFLICQPNFFLKCRSTLFPSLLQNKVKIKNRTVLWTVTEY